MAWLFVPKEQVQKMSAAEVRDALQAVITARRRTHTVAVVSGPVMALAAIAAIGLSWWLVPALMGTVFAWGIFRFWAWHLYRSACVLGVCGYARDALVGRMSTSDNLGFGPNN